MFSDLMDCLFEKTCKISSLDHYNKDVPEEYQNLIIIDFLAELWFYASKESGVKVLWEDMEGKLGLREGTLTNINSTEFTQALALAKKRANESTKAEVSEPTGGKDTIEEMIDCQDLSQIEVYVDFINRNWRSLKKAIESEYSVKLEDSTYDIEEIINEKHTRLLNLYKALLYGFAAMNKEFASKTLDDDAGNLIIALYIVMSYIRDNYERYPNPFFNLCHYWGKIVEDEVKKALDLIDERFEGKKGARSIKILLYNASTNKTKFSEIPDPTLLDSSTTKPKPSSHSGSSSASPSDDKAPMIEEQLLEIAPMTEDELLKIIKNPSRLDEIRPGSIDMALNIIRKDWSSIMEIYLDKDKVGDLTKRGPASLLLLWFVYTVLFCACMKTKDKNDINQIILQLNYIMNLLRIRDESPLPTTQTISDLRHFRNIIDDFKPDSFQKVAVCIWHTITVLINLNDKEASEKIKSCFDSIHSIDNILLLSLYSTEGMTILDSVKAKQPKQQQDYRPYTPDPTLPSAPNYRSDHEDKAGNRPSLRSDFPEPYDDQDRHRSSRSSLKNGRDADKKSTGSLMGVIIFIGSVFVVMLLGLIFMGGMLLGKRHSPAQSLKHRQPNKTVPQ